MSAPESVRVWTYWSFLLALYQLTSGAPGSSGDATADRRTEGWPLCVPSPGANPTGSRLPCGYGFLLNGMPPRGGQG